MSPTQSPRTNGFSLTTSYESTKNAMTPSSGTNLSGAYSLVDPFPLGILTPLGAKEGLLTNIGRGVTFDPRQQKIPPSPSSIR